MKISARNKLTGTVVDMAKGATTSPMKRVLPEGGEAHDHRPAAQRINRQQLLLGT